MKTVLIVVTAQNGHFPKQLINFSLGSNGTVVYIMQSQGTVKKGPQQLSFWIDAVHHLRVEVQRHSGIGLVSNQIRSVGLAGSHEKDFSVFKFMPGAFRDVISVSPEDAEDLAGFMGMEYPRWKWGINGGLTVADKPVVAASDCLFLWHKDHLWD